MTFTKVVHCVAMHAMGHRPLQCFASNVRPIGRPLQGMAWPSYAVAHGQVLMQRSKHCPMQGHVILVKISFILINNNYILFVENSALHEGYVVQSRWAAAKQCNGLAA